MTPYQANQEVVWQRLYGGEASEVKPTLQVGDRVRISKIKRRFKKGYLPNWTEEIFSILKVHRSNPPVYRLSDERGKTLDGTFYEPEIQKVLVEKNKRYRVGAVLRRRSVGKRTQLLVKWFGYPSHSNVGSTKKQSWSIKVSHTPTTSPVGGVMDGSTDIRSDTGSSLSRWEICGNKFPKSLLQYFLLKSPYCIR